MRCRPRQRGMSLVVAIFLITVIASLAAFAVTVGTATHETENLQLLADRARAAASAGAEWATYRAANGVPPNNCLASTTFNLTQAALRGFRVRVTCTRLGSIARPVYDIDSFAQAGTFGAVNYTSRHVTKRVW